jgi:hypothetical protein
MNTAILHELTHHRPATDTGRHRCVCHPHGSSFEMAAFGTHLISSMGE